MVQPRRNGLAIFGPCRFLCRLTRRALGFRQERIHGNSFGVPNGRLARGSSRRLLWRVGNPRVVNYEDSRGNLYRIQFRMRVEWQRRQKIDVLCRIVCARKRRYVALVVLSTYVVNQTEREETTHGQPADDLFDGFHGPLVFSFICFFRAFARMRASSLPRKVNARPAHSLRGHDQAALQKSTPGRATRARRGRPSASKGYRFGRFPKGSESSQTQRFTPKTSCSFRL